jgi:hypothetical protein
MVAPVPPAWYHYDTGNPPPAQHFNGVQFPTPSTGLEDRHCTAQHVSNAQEMQVVLAADWGPAALTPEANTLQEAQAH